MLLLTDSIVTLGGTGRQLATPLQVDTAWGVGSLEVGEGGEECEGLGHVRNRSSVFTSRLPPSVLLLPSRLFAREHLFIPVRFHRIGLEGKKGLGWAGAERGR